MKRKALYVVAALSLILATACGNPKLKNGEKVVAKVNNKEYTAEELYEELKGQYGYSTIINWVDSTIAEAEVETTDEIKKYADEAIEFYKSYADQYGMSLADFAKSYLGLSNVKNDEDVKKYLILDRKLNLAIQNHLAKKIEDSEVKDFYNENYKKTFTYREILITDNDDAEDTIDDIRDSLKGKKDDELVKEFKSIAKDKSKASTAKDGGLVENATKNKVNSKLWEELEDLDDYEYSKGIKTDSGYYIILKISENKAKDLKDVEKEIRETIAQNKLSTDQFLSYDILTELRNKYKLAFFDKDIKSKYDEYLKQVEDSKKEASNSNKNNEKSNEKNNEKKND